MQRTWSRIKAYLTTWKTTNFGSGTYSNAGSLTIYSSGSVRFGDNSEELNISMRRGIVETYNFSIDFNGNEVNNGSLDLTASNAGMAVFNFTMMDADHNISFGSRVNYIIISKKGISYGTGTSYTYSGQSVVLVFWSMA